MNYIRTLSVKLQLTWLVIAVLIGLVTLSSFNRYQTAKVYEITNFSNINSIPAMVMLSDAIYSASEMNSNVNRYLVTKDQTTQQDLQNRLSQLMASVNKAMQDYETTLAGDQDTRMYKDDLETIKQYVQVITDAKAYASTHDDVTTALEMNMDAATEVVKTLRAHLNYNQELANDAQRQAVATKAQADTINLLLCSAIMAGLVGLAYLAYRNLIIQLGCEPALINAIGGKIAKGDLSTNITLLPGDKASLLYRMHKIQQTCGFFVAAQKQVADLHAKGESDQLLWADNFPGVYSQMAHGINQLLSYQIKVRAQLVDTVSKYAHGDFSVEMDRLPGKEIEVSKAIDSIRDGMQTMQHDIMALVNAALVGNLNKRIDANQYQYAFKEMINGINQTLDAIIGPVQAVMHLLSAMEQGDLTQRIDQSYHGQLEELRTAANNTVVKLAETISEVISATSQLNNAAEQISATSQSLSQAASEQASSVDETSASIEQISASINHNAENAKVTDSMAGKTAQEANQGGIAVKQTVNAMNEIANKIGIIDDIAYQTNMLALNAAIEAARAGEQGKGFAVVASEVRKLAERSQIAAQEIGKLAESSVSTAESAGQLLEAIVPSIAKTSDLVQEIAAASQEQSSGVSQVNLAMSQMSQITQQNASASEELAATAEQMTGQAEQLLNLMSFFQIERRTQSREGQPQKVARLPTNRPLTKKPMPAKRAESNEGEFDLAKFQRF